MTVLRMRGLEGEAELPFAGLAELCEPVLGAARPAAGRPDGGARGALELEPAPPRPGWRSAPRCSGLLSLAAEERPVLCVVDEVQWLDEPSLEAMRFAGAGSAPTASPCCWLSGRVPDAAPGSKRSSSARSPRARARAAAGRALHPVPELVARRVLDTAAGNPLALLEIPALLSRDELEGRARSKGRCRPARRSSACSRAGSTGWPTTPAARC